MPVREEQLANIFAQGRETIRPTRGGLASDIGARIAESPLARGLGLGPFGASMRDIGTGLPASQIALAAAGPVALGADIATLGTTGAARQAATNLARQLPRGRTITGQHFAREQWPTLDPTMVGSNPRITGAERARGYTNPPDATHLYDIEAGIRPEVGLGPQVMTAEIPRTLELGSKQGQKLRQRVRQRLTRDAEKAAAGRYRPVVDPAQLATEIEREAVRQGYHGIENRGVVKAFYDLPVQRRGEVPIELRGRGLSPQGIARYAEGRPGATVNPVTGEVPQEGIATAMRGGEQVVPTAGQAEAITRRLTENPPAPGNYFGTWQGPGGRTYLDETTVRSPGLRTRLAGERNYQLAQYDITRDREIPMTLRPAVENLPRAASQLARNPLIAGLRPLASPLQLEAVERSSRLKKAKAGATGAITRSALLDAPKTVSERRARMSEFLDQPIEPWQPQVSRSIFDRSLIPQAMQGHPGVAQTPVERYVGRKEPEHVRPIFSPENIDLVERQIQRGLSQGGETYYPSTYPIRARYEEIQSPDVGFEDFVRANMATSPQAALPINIPNASLYTYLMRRGVEPTWENVQKLAQQIKQDFGVGYFTGPGHAKNFALADDMTGFETQQKIHSYGEGLRGNFAPMAIDTHETKGLSMGTRHFPYFDRQKGVKKTEYGPVEAGYRDIAEGMGLPGATAQAGRWFGGGPLTGLRSPQGDFLNTLEDLIRYNAETRGWATDPRGLQQKADEYLRGDVFLLPYWKRTPMIEYNRELFR